MPQIIDGKRISTEIKEELKQEVAALKEKGITGALAVIQVGDDPASIILLIQYFFGIFAALGHINISNPSNKNNKSQYNCHK